MKRRFRIIRVLAQVPTLETPEGGVFESNAMARYVARLADKGLFGATTYEEVGSFVAGYPCHISHASSFEMHGDAFQGPPPLPRPTLTDSFRVCSLACSFSLPSLPLPTPQTHSITDSNRTGLLAHTLCGKGTENVEEFEVHTPLRGGRKGRRGVSRVPTHTRCRLRGLVVRVSWVFSGER